MRRIARPYAQALLSVAGSLDEAAKVRDQLAAMASTLDGAQDLKSFFANPALSVEQKQRVLGQVMDRLAMAPLGRRLLQALLSRHRLGQLDDVVAGVSEAIQQRQGVAVAEVTTAEPLGDDERGELRRVLEGQWKAAGDARERRPGPHRRFRGAGRVAALRRQPARPARPLARSWGGRSAKNRRCARAHPTQNAQGALRPQRRRCALRTIRIIREPDHGLEPPTKSPPSSNASCPATRSTSTSPVGTVVTSATASRVSSLQKCMANEMLAFPNDVSASRSTSKRTRSAPC